MNEQVREPEWAPETDEANVRNRRAWSIEDLRSRLGVAAPAEQESKRRQPEAGNQTGELKRPRIVLRGVEQAAA